MTTPTIGTALVNSHTGTRVTIANIFDNGMCLLSNGSYCPLDSLLDRWEIIERKAETV